MHAVNYFEENEKNAPYPRNMGIVMEKISPKGYVWAKVQQCWMGDASGHRFFPETVHPRTGLSMPAAYIGTVIAYDPDAGYHERKIKLVGYEAVLAEQWRELGSALISCEGHIAQQSWHDGSGAIHCENLIIVKQGMLTIHQSPQPLPIPSSVDSIEMECLEDSLLDDMLF